MFGGILFTNANGTQPDFFIFETAGSGIGNPDDISIAAILPDDSLGQAVTCPTIYQRHREQYPDGVIPDYYFRLMVVHLAKSLRDSAGTLPT